VNIAQEKEERENSKARRRRFTNARMRRLVQTRTMIVATFKKDVRDCSNSERRMDGGEGMNEKSNSERRLRESLSNLARNQKRQKREGGIDYFTKGDMEENGQKTIFETAVWSPLKGF